MSEQPTGELRFRQATSGPDVSFPERTIEVVVMPYEQETVVEHRGRMIKEAIARGAFDGIQRRRITANRDHDDRRVVGRTIALHPEHEEGLVAEIKISNTELGTETLNLVNDEVLKASAGYLPLPGGEKWLTRSSVRILKGWLGHIAFVPEPAYEGARALSVRHGGPHGLSGASEQPVPTPNLDQLRDQLARERYEELSRQIG